MEEKLKTIPSLEEIKEERSRIRHRHRYLRTLRSTVLIMFIIAAAAIALAVIVFPFYRIYGKSMEPSLSDDEIVACVKSDSFHQGDIIAYYYSNKIQIKRVVGMPGDTVDIKSDGSVYVNGELLNEDYVTALSFGGSDLTYPYEVPEDMYFVLGDNREEAVDSRYSVVGCVSKEQAIGRIILRIWPLDQLEVLH